MKSIFYTIFLILIISSDFINTGYTLFCKEHHIEYSKDFTTEKESNEKTEADEKEYEFSLLAFSLQTTLYMLGPLEEEASKLQSKFSSDIPSPPPDK